MAPLSWRAVAELDGGLAERLGIVRGVKVAIVNEPEGWVDELALPEGVVLFDRASEPLDVLVYFSDELANVDRRVPVFAGFLAPGGTLWMATPDSSKELARAVVEAIGVGAGLSVRGAEVVAAGWTAVGFERS